MTDDEKKRFEEEMRRTLPDADPKLARLGAFVRALHPEAPPSELPLEDLEKETWVTGVYGPADNWVRVKGSNDAVVQVGFNRSNHAMVLKLISKAPQMLRLLRRIAGLPSFTASRQEARALLEELERP